MSLKTKDFLERLGMTLLLAAISFGITYLADVPEAWALAVLAVLQIAKNIIAQQVGDPATSGFVNPLPQNELPRQDLQYDGDDLPLDDPVISDE